MVLNRWPIVAGAESCEAVDKVVVRRLERLSVSVLIESIKLLADDCKPRVDAAASYIRSIKSPKTLRSLIAGTCV